MIFTPACSFTNICSAWQDSSKSCCIGFPPRLSRGRSPGPCTRPSCEQSCDLPRRHYRPAPQAIDTQRTHDPPAPRTGPRIQPLRRSPRRRSDSRPPAGRGRLVPRVTHPGSAVERARPLRRGAPRERLYSPRRSEKMKRDPVPTGLRRPSERSAGPDRSDSVECRSGAALPCEDRSIRKGNAR